MMAYYTCTDIVCFPLPRAKYFNIMEKAIGLETNSENSEDIIPIVRTIPVHSSFEEIRGFLNSGEHSQPLSSDCREELEEISDSEDELELVVDAIHPRLSTSYYFCARCKGKFASKKILYSHFEGGCYVSCKKCGKRVYEKRSGVKDVFVQKCSRRCHPVLVNEVPKE